MRGRAARSNTPGQLLLSEHLGESGEDAIGEIGRSLFSFETQVVAGAFDLN